MKKLVFFMFVISLSFKVNSQIVDLSINSILNDKTIHKFVGILDENARDLIKLEEADSVMVLCIVPDYYVAANFATVFWKKDGKCHSFVFIAKRYPKWKDFEKGHK